MPKTNSILSCSCCNVLARQGCSNNIQKKTVIKYGMFCITWLRICLMVN